MVVTYTVSSFAGIIYGALTFKMRKRVVWRMSSTVVKPQKSG